MAIRLRHALVTATVVSLLVVTAAGASSPSKWRGNSGPCKRTLRDTSDYRTAPLAAKDVGKYVFHWVVQGYVNWNDPHYTNRGSVTFHTCPPKRVMIIGDSIAFTLGVPWLTGESNWGIEVADAPILGCTFGDRGYFYNRQDKPQPLPPGCPNAYKQWAKTADESKAQEVIVEMGYRSEFDYSWSNQTVHLGESQFDSFVHGQIESLIQVLGTHGRKILFLTVPYVQPSTWPNGQPDPASSTSRHRMINQMITTIAHQHRPDVAVYDIDKVVSPGDHYDTYVNGTFCRWDGLHFTPQCAWMLQDDVLSAARELLKR